MAQALSSGLIPGHGGLGLFCSASGGKAKGGWGETSLRMLCPRSPASSNGDTLTSSALQALGGQSGGQPKRSTNAVKVDSTEDECGLPAPALRLNFIPPVWAADSSRVCQS